MALLNYNHFQKSLKPSTTAIISSFTYLVNDQPFTRERPQENYLHECSVLESYKFKLRGTNFMSSKLAEKGKASITFIAFLL